MASETVKIILEAEAEADRKNAEARANADERVSKAKRDADIAVQKKLAEAKAEIEKLRKGNEKRLDEYRKKAADEADRTIRALDEAVQKNTDRAVDSVIRKYFG